MLAIGRLSAETLNYRHNSTLPYYLRRRPAEGHSDEFHTSSEDLRPAVQKVTAAAVSNDSKAHDLEETTVRPVTITLLHYTAGSFIDLVETLRNVDSLASDE